MLGVRIFDNVFGIREEANSGVERGQPGNKKRVAMEAKRNYVGMELFAL